MVQDVKIKVHIMKVKQTFSVHISSKNTSYKDTEQNRARVVIYL